ncbi:unnamed protein product [Amoebophrya sp. A120]|nr:unnamed protein product [Amoebophrya sp. A120]|eukprot:GSA120T00010785001.1
MSTERQLDKALLAGSSSPSSPSAARPAAPKEEKASGSGTTPASSSAEAARNALEQAQSLDERVSKARSSLQSMLADLSKTKEGIQEAQKVNRSNRSASADLDAKWQQFQEAFDEANRRLIGAIAQGLQSENIVPGQGRIMPSSIVKDTSWYDTIPEEERAAVFNDDISLKTLADKIRKGLWKDLVVMTGAGISVSAGIPDFRSKNGLYEKLRREHGMSRPESLFDISYFKQNPEPFRERALEMLPGKFAPTVTHFFLQLLLQKDLLRRVYTQNIDTLEKQAGLPDEKVVYAHGSFADVHCVECGAQVSLTKWREDIEKGIVPRCSAIVKKRIRNLEFVAQQTDENNPPTSTSPDAEEDDNPEAFKTVEESCNGLVKPDIVFFGENLPDRFHQLRKADFKAADCVLVLGTSLQVAPFNRLITHCDLKTPRVLINNEMVGTCKDFGTGGFQFEHEKNFRDLFLSGSCDDVVRELAEELGWAKELEDLQRNFSRGGDGWKLMVDNQPKDGS